MSKKNTNSSNNSGDRKKDHINLTKASTTSMGEHDRRFNYEPMLSGFPNKNQEQISFLDKKFSAPIWISSMTGGTEFARIINHNLAKACGEFGLGMGLGSCRSLLDSEEHFNDFNVRKLVGDQPLYANLGIAQIEKLLEQKETFKIESLVKKLEADGLIIHINPLQEYLQPEGDTIQKPPIQTITKLLDIAKYKIIVKEVGQGMGPESIKALLNLPIEALDFAAYGGTNFSKLEQLRQDNKTNINPISFIGHSTYDMLASVNTLVSDANKTLACQQLIISGGVKNYLDGYYLVEQSKLPAVYGQAAAFLENAKGSYEVLQEFVQSQIDSLRLAKAFLKPIK